MQAFREKHGSSKGVAANRKTRYGVTPEAFAEMAADGCPGCGRADRLSLDHDHACCPGGRACPKCVRGVLCSNCNSALGLVADDRQVLLNLVAYLDKWNSRSVV